MSNDLSTLFRLSRHAQRRATAISFIVLFTQVIAVLAQGDETSKSADIHEIEETYLSSLSALATTIETARTDAKKSDPALAQKIDPWGGLDQIIEPPEPREKLRFWTKQAVRPPLPKNYQQYIPPRYRLGEALEIGVNRYQLYQEFTDGKIFSAAEYGFELRHHLKFDLVGEFYRKELSNSVEIFRQSLESRGRVVSRHIHVGSDVKPHKVSFHEVPIGAHTDFYSQANVWIAERIGERFEEESKAVAPSKAATRNAQESHQMLERDLRKALREKRALITKSQQAALQSSPMLQPLNGAVEQLRKWELSSHDPNRCSIEICSERLLDQQKLEQQLTDQIEATAPLNLDHLIKEQQQTLKLMRIHGLIHRAPPQESNALLMDFIQLLQTKTSQ